MSHDSHGNPVATYIITALILGGITYVEYAIVEYEIAWLSRNWTFFWLILLSVVKFFMVVAIFMHLKDDERTYTGFFSSGMLIALATFLILPLLFTVRTLPTEAESAPREAHAAEAPADEEQDGHAEEALSEETRQAIETDGYSRSRSETLDTPPPKRRSLAVEPPAAGEARATLRSESPSNETEAAGGEEAGLGEDPLQAQVDEPAEQGQAQPEQAAEGGQEPSAQQNGQPGQIDFDRELGESTYASNCQSCHQAGGTGIPGAFPPLAGNMPDLVAAEGGREYLIDVLLYGLTGEIEVNGQTYDNVMPAWDSLSDEQIAAVLNHELTAWGNEQELADFTAIGAEEISERRGEDPGDLAERRSELQLP